MQSFKTVLPYGTFWQKGSLKNPIEHFLRVYLWSLPLVNCLQLGLIYK